MKSIPNKSNLIDKALKSTELNQSELAQKIGVSAAQISKWKRGEAIPKERQNSLKVMLANCEPPSPLLEVFKAIKDEYLDDRGSNFEFMFEELSETFIDQLNELLDAAKMEEISQYGTHIAPYCNEDIEELIHDLLFNLQKLERWHEHFLHDADDRYSTFELEEDIREHYTPLAWKEIRPELLEKCGVNTHNLALWLETTMVRLKGELYNYCNALNYVKAAYTTNYHVLLQDKPASSAAHDREVDELLSYNATSSAQLLPYSERIAIEKMTMLEDEINKLKTEILVMKAKP